MTVNKLKEEIKKLTPHERILFVQYILNTIAEDTADPEEGFHLSDEWKAELDKRSNSFQRGNLKTTSWEDIKSALLNK